MKTTHGMTGKVGVHSIDHFALTVPDMDTARSFYSAFGLQVQAKGDELWLSAGDGHRWAILKPGAYKALAYLSFNCFEADFALLRAQLIAAGAREASPPEQLQETAFWFHDPDGNLLCVKSGPKTTPASKAPNAVVNIPANARGAQNGGAVAQIRPGRMSHVLLFSPEVSRSVDFYCDGLGLNVSDRSQDIIAFLHAPHGSDHHLVAFAKSARRGWHHSSWDVSGVDDVGLGARQMALAGYPDGWGTGRHVLGSNYFHYVRDPWGSFAEYSAHIDFIDAGFHWPGRDHPVEDSLYLWGPQVPSYFIENTETHDIG